MPYIDLFLRLNFNTDEHFSDEVFIYWLMQSLYYIVRMGCNKYINRHHQNTEHWHCETKTNWIDCKIIALSRIYIIFNYYSRQNKKTLIMIYIIPELIQYTETTQNTFFYIFNIYVVRSNLVIRNTHFTNLLYLQLM